MMKRGLLAALFAALIGGVLVSAALAQSTSPVMLPSGCGTGNLAGAGNAYPTVDPGARWCVNISGYTYTHILSNQTTVVKAVPGVLHSITINTKGISPNTASVFDNTVGSGTTIAVIDTSAGVETLLYDTVFKTGLTIVTTGGTAADITVSAQ